VREVDAGHALQELAAEVRRATRARRGIIDLSGTRTRERDELLHVFGRQRRMRDHHEMDRDDLRERGQIALGIDRHLRVEMLVDREIAHRPEQPRVAVGRCPRGRFGPDDARGAGAVLDDRLLPAPDLRELRRHHSRHDVGAAAGRERDDDANGFRRKGRRLRVQRRDARRRRHRHRHRSAP
jgi:hypothetical protein